MSDILLTAAQMRALEAAAIESGATTGRALMERAGEGAVDAILTEWPDLLDAPGQAVILCGPGNNGGDGFVVARLLAGRGWAVDLYLHGDPEGLPPDARANHDLWAEIGDVRPLPTVDDDGDPVTAEDIRTVGEAPDLIVDALFGTGLTRPLGPLGAVVAALDLDGLRDDDPAWPRVVALDIPSGLCADSGRVLGDPAVAVAAHLTVAFGYPKRGHLLADAPARCGRLRLVDLDLDGMVSPDIQREIEETSPPPEDVAADFMEPEARDFHRWELLKRAGHKYSHGHAFVLTGGMGRTGAARLAARGALRVGAGLVTLGAPGPAMMECAVQSTALMLRRCADGAALSARLEDGRIT
ncbi:MAG: NAD(P)H-hydrate epimerase, partial [Pseudomonadota bacterium]